MTRLASIGFLANPLATLILSEPAAANLANTITNLQSQGVSVFTFPLTARLLSPRQAGPGAVQFTFTGPPGTHMVENSTNLILWSNLGSLTNTLGSAVFIDGAIDLLPRKFYRTRSAP